MEHRFWGQHLILDLSGCPKEKITDPNNIKSWSINLIEAIDMVAFGDPFLKYFDNHDPGYTFSQIILTSNITAHFVDNHGGAYIDIFSCKEFSAQEATDVTKKYFAPEKVVIRELYRGVKN